jgi:hypothetical protein
MEEFTRTRVVFDSTTKISSDHKAVRITEVVELSEDEMSDIIADVIDGNFYHSASEEAMWQQIKETGTVISYKEENGVIFSGEA